MPVVSRSHRMHDVPCAAQGSQRATSLRLGRVVVRSVRWLLIAILVLVSAEIALVGIVTLSPDAREGISALMTEVATIWSGSEERPGNIELVGEAATDFRDTWLKPLWTNEPPISVDLDFIECIKCHGSYAEQVVSGSLFVGHSLHAANGIECFECHTDTAHPSPLPPSEDTCAGCHTQVARTSGSDDCWFCHKPGSLNHYEKLGVPARGVVNCNACHLHDLFNDDRAPLTSIPRFDGNDAETCANCHYPSTCDSCHDAGHPDEWISLHGEEVTDSAGASASCTRCHTTRWCSDSCHRSQTLGGGEPIPLPTGEDDQ